MPNNAQSLRQAPVPVASNAADKLYSSTVSLLVAPFALPIFRILTTRKAQRVLLAVAILNIQARVEKHFFLREDDMDLGSLGGLQISLTNLALSGLYIAWLVGIAIRSRSIARPRRSPNKVTLPRRWSFCSLPFHLLPPSMPH